jgi:hypothetical protein
MDIDKPIKLRPRFRYYTNNDKSFLIERIKSIRIKYKSKFKIKLSGDHIWIHHSKVEEKIYTPHLHLEMVEDDYDQPDKLLIKGLYSPNSSYWTMFMFLHFILAGLFIGFAIMAYTKSILDEAYSLYIYLMISIGLIWVGLYFFARYNRKRGLKQAYALEDLFKEWVKA